MLKTIFFWILVAFCLSGTCVADNFGFEFAGQEYDIAPELLLAISIVESDHSPHAINLNHNKSIDIGHMQINSFWKEKLGYRWTLLDNPVYCTLVGAWILRGCIARYGYNWNAVACYHTGYSIGDAPTEEKRISGFRYVIQVRKALHEKNDKKKNLD